MDYLDELEQIVNNPDPFTDGVPLSIINDGEEPRKVWLHTLTNLLGEQYERIENGSHVAVEVHVNKDSMKAFTDSPIGKMWLFSCITKEFLADPRFARASIPLMKQLIKYIRGCLLMAEATTGKD